MASKAMPAINTLIDAPRNTPPRGFPSLGRRSSADWKRIG